MPVTSVMGVVTEIAKDDIHLAGEKMYLRDIVGKMIVVTGYKITKITSS